MTDFTTLMFNLLADFYQKPNIRLFLGVLNRQMRDLETMFQDLTTILDIDQASGNNLNIFLQNLNIVARQNDEETRNLIKTTIKSNNSQGTIPDMVEIANAILEENYRGINEAWERSEYNNRPAQVIINAQSNPNIGNVNVNDFKRIAPAGVSVLLNVLPNPPVPLQTGTVATPVQMGVLF